MRNNIDDQSIASVPPCPACIEKTASPLSYGPDRKSVISYWEMSLAAFAKSLSSMRSCIISKSSISFLSTEIRFSVSDAFFWSPQKLASYVNFSNEVTSSFFAGSCILARILSSLRCRSSFSLSIRRLYYIT